MSFSYSHFKTIMRYASLVMLACVCFLFFYFDLYEYLSLSKLKSYQAAAESWTNAHYELAVSLYIIIFTLLIACAIPCATVLTLVGGFLFDVIAILYAEFSITLGGTILYLVIRTTLGSRLAARSTGWIKKIEGGFNEDAFNYILSLRLIPIMPCWVSNIGAGMLNVPLKIFVSATLLGILPATIIYVLAGRGLDTILMQDDTPVLNILLTPLVLFPLIGLAILSLFPVFYKWMKKRNPDE